MESADNSGNSFNMRVKIRRAGDADFDGIWEIFKEVVDAGETYPQTSDIGREEAYRLLLADPTATYVAVDQGRVVGMYYLEPNQPGRGAHVGHAGYAVARDARGRGVGRALGRHSLTEARRRGFLAMQFNLVVATNEASVALWQGLGFTVAGTLPKAFRHRELGLVDALVMYRLLDDLPGA